MRGDIVGPHGLGQRNKNGQYIIDCCHKHNLSVLMAIFQVNLG